MTSFNDSVIATASRPVRLRRCPDLVVARQHFEGRDCWVLKDPIGMNYVRLDDPEYAVLELLDGKTSTREIKAAFDARFAPDEIRLEELAQMFALFHQSGLVYSEAPGQGEELGRRRAEHNRNRGLSWLMNPLSMRFKGVNPRRFLDGLYAWFGWLYSPQALGLSLALILAALVLILAKFDDFLAQLPTFHQYFTFETAILLFITLGAVKVLHELGHGLTCRHFGGECTELGMMLLVFTPCLYCKVSDSWMLPNKWHRAAIAAAGIYVELVLSAIATFIWWFTTDGLLHHIALNVMFVCSVTTIFFNANPLMRFDGYYILIDLIEVPNLDQKANQYVQRSLASLLLGIEPPQQAYMSIRRRVLYVAFALAAFGYRMFVYVTVIWFLYRFFEPYHLTIIAQLLGLASLTGMVGFPLYRLARYLRVPGRGEEMDRRRARATFVGLGLVALLLAVVPLPHRAWGTLELKPLAPQNVYVEVPGELIEMKVAPGQRVEPGTLLAQLRNLDLEFEIARLKARRGLLQAQLDGLVHRRSQEREISRQIPELESTLAAVTEQLEQKQQHFERLALRATRAGTVLPAPLQARRPLPPGELATWSGSLFEPRNRDCYLEQGTLLCQVGDTGSYEAQIVLDQADVSYVIEGQQVAIKLDESPTKTLWGTLTEIAHSDLKISPRTLSNKVGGELATRTDETGAERPLSVSYQARVPIHVTPGELRTGFRGRAKIILPWESAAQQGWRWFSQTFHFRL
ncbi:MAG: hemolysin D [Planctomycetes bacterium]|nr:hemolysin D [Planctomycetota bacterium]